ncbi:EamA family transporter RarD [Pelagibacteraceae bacterium]|nr:EamA family transporter RarD [Pelagibacteraceae bacterium]
MKNILFFKGIFYTCLASLFWGMPQPLFFNQIKYIPSIEVAMHRGLWSFVLLFILLFFLNEIKDFISLFNSSRKIIILSITGILIAINWTGFIYSVSIKQVQDASLGYFLTPMISVVFGFFFLNEKININKVISVILMFIASLIIFLSQGNFPLISILIGTTWAIYGLLRKQIKVSAATGLLYESGFITIFALPYLIYLSFLDIGYMSITFNFTTIMLILTGAVTIFPLFFFNLGLKYIPLGLAGVLFYIAPSFHFITSLFVLEEYIEFEKIIAFILIWIGVVIFIYDVIKKK